MKAATQKYTYLCPSWLCPTAPSLHSGAPTQSTINSPVSPLTSILPLIFVVSVTAVKQGYEDWLRHREDSKVNNAEAKVLSDGKLAVSIHGDAGMVDGNTEWKTGIMNLSLMIISTMQ